MSTWACDRRGAGALADLVTIERLKSDAPRNAAGEVEQHSAEAWETWFQDWAEIHQEQGAEVGQPTQQIGLRRWRLRIRNHEDSRAITPLMRITLPDGEILNITWAGDPDRKNVWIEIAGVEQTT